MSRLFASVLIAPSLALAMLAAQPASAADLTKFHTACLNGVAFLLGEVPEGKDAQPVMDALCPCIETGFETYSQPEIDALEADLRTGSSDEARAAYADYETLQDKATAVLGTCFASDAVMTAARAQGL